MAENGDIRSILVENEDEISAILAASIESTNKSKSVELPPEDAFWADSCLISDYNWDILKVALLETLNTPSIVTEDNEQDNYVQLKEEKEEVVEGGVNEEEDDDDDEEMLLRDDIFKVWDLDINEELKEEEENELIKQLKKALMVSKYQVSSQFSLSELDDLVAGMGDLSLEPTVLE